MRMTTAILLNFGKSLTLRYSKSALKFNIVQYKQKFLHEYSATNKSQTNKIAPFGWFLLSVPITTFGLGCWQVKRKTWKENLIRELEQRSHSEPVPMPENLNDLNDMEYKPVVLTGRFLHDKELYLGPRSFIRSDGAENKKGVFTKRDDSIGYLVVTPFKLTGREETVLINRGWVPRNFIKPESRPQGQIEGEVRLTAVYRKGEKRPQFSPDHKGNIYLYRDLDKMCAATGADPIFFDTRYDSTISGGPIGGQTRITLRNEHLSYILTWFSLSAATACMWYYKIYKNRIIVI